MSKIKWKEHLNETQFEAVSQTDGPMLVVAGAGSGKTRVLTYRVAYLIQEKNIPPDSIMAITFTNKAAGEMKDRLIDLCGRRRYHPWVGTFHRTCADILRNYSPAAGMPSKFTVFDESEQEVVIKRILKKLSIDPKQNPPKKYLYRISRAKSHLITPEEFESDAHNRFEQETARIYNLYQKELRSQNAYDFDDLIMETCLLLENHKPTRDLLQEHYMYIHVDEFQDINPAQYELIKHLTNPKSRNIFVVGDDDQAIYGWRYADPAFIDKFQNDFKPVKIIKLEDNYRSSIQILDVANEIIRMKSWGFPKVLRSRKDSGEPPIFYLAQSDSDEAYYVAQIIQESVEKGANYSDFAVLYRTNALSRIFEETFGRFNINHQVIGGLRFYQRMEIKDILGYFRVLVNDKDKASLQRIINTPKRGIGDKSRDKIFEFLERHDIGLFELADKQKRSLLNELPDSIYSKFEPFLKLMLEFKKQSALLGHVELLEWILEKTGYEALLRKENSIESLARVDNLDELKGAFASFQDDYPDEGIDRFIEQVSLASDLDNYEAQKDAVTMMTLHSAKGLEFKYVFLPCLEQNVLPHFRSIDSPLEIDEERRLLYVGITRAEECLFLSCAQRRYMHGRVVPNDVSQFLRDIPRELVHGLETIDHRHRLTPEDSSSRRWSKPRTTRQLDDFDDEFDHEPMPSEQETIKRRAGRRKKRATPLKTDYAVGDQISHPTFGIGKIVQINPSTGDNYISIAFENEIGVKILSEKAAPLTKVDE